jgi:D-inositol-3-phosphate glycosyltransferase
MISFVWSDPLPLYAGRGGTESFTIGHVRELTDRGIDARIVTLGLGEEDGRQFYDDIAFHNLESAEELSELDDILVYVNFPFNVPTKQQSFVFYHIPPLDRRNRIVDYKALQGDSIILTNSRYLRSVWADHLDVNPNKIHIVYPFADPVFANAKRAEFSTEKTRVLFAGRLVPEKGIFTLMEAIHHTVLSEGNFSFAATNAGNQTYPGDVIEKLLDAHPMIRVINARKTPAEMARLYARYDIVVVPSNHQYWHEAFGMVSVEAQHAGCKVVVTKADGLIETDCGELLLFEPGNSYDLARKIAKAAKSGPILPEQRAESALHFTRESSVNSLLRAVDRFCGTEYRKVPSQVVSVK